jgi:hypothetical protein
MDRNEKLSTIRGMKRLPLNVQTLYADLAQSLTFSTTIPASISTHTARGKAYLYAVEKHGSARVKRYLGPADHPDAQKEADEVRRSAEQAKARRTTVSMIKRAGVAAPTLEMGRVLEALSNAGLFRNGVILVGTAAYQVYSAVVGAYLSHAAATTQDADLAAASLAVVADTTGEDLLAILRRADPSFVSQIGLDPRVPPKRFRSAAGLDVDVLTRYRSRADDERPIVIPGLRCSAQPLRYLEFLMQDPMTAVALYGAGIQTLVPQPARYAVHKLIVAQVRTDGSTKRAKDLAQSKELIEALAASDPHSVPEAIENACRRGVKWSMHIEQSLREIGHADLARKSPPM